MQVTVEKLILTPAKIKMLQNCMTDDRTRDALRGVNVKGDIVESTNGRILIQIPLENKIPEGLYKITDTKEGVATLELLEGLKFPDTTRVMPERRKSLPTTKVFLGKGMAVSVVVIKLFQINGNAVHEDLIGGLVPLDTDWIATQEKKDAPFLLTTSDGIKATVMPLQFV